MGAVPPVIGRYTPVGRLGSGGMADVFLVVARGPERVEKLTVVKRLRYPEKPELIQMFLDEARLAVRLNHPNIVHTYEVAETSGEYFMTMEYLEGQPLSEVLTALADRSDGLSDSCVASVAVQALKGLDYAHELCDFDGTPLGIVHRDVSPHNVYVTYTGEVKLLDFGIAKARLNSTRTETGILKGKLRYMSPEQAGEQEVDRRSDIFSMGVVVWEMLARRALFSGDAIALLNQIAAQKIPRLTELRPEISRALEAIVLKSLQREPGSRYSTADQMRLDIQRTIRGAGDDDSRAELARVMNELFSSQRDTLRSQIRTHLAKPNADASSSPLNLQASLPTLVVSAVEVSGSLQLNASKATSAPRPRRRGRFVAGTALAIAAAIGGIRLAWRTDAVAPAASSRATSAPAPSARANLHLETIPPGAYVEWEGQRFGPTPADVVLRAGLQKLAITSEGYEGTLLTVDAQPGEDIRRTVTLHAMPPLVTNVRGPASTASASLGSKHDTPLPRSARPNGTATSPPLSAAPAASAATATSAANATNATNAPTTVPSPSARPPELRIQMLDESDAK